MSAKYVEVQCSECKKKFPRRADKVKDSTAMTGPYCSSTCQNAGMKKYRQYKAAFTKSAYTGVHSCPTCGEDFSPYHPNVVYCSKLCRTRAQNARTAQRYKDRVVIGGDYDKINRKETKAVLLKTIDACPICLTSFDSIELKQVHVDHNHRTGTLRSLLCSNCNQGLGNLKITSST